MTATMADTKIDGVVIKPLHRNIDDRGWLTEIHRCDEDTLKPAMGYISFTKHGVIRGPHEHVKQSDFFIFTGPGDFELYLWDNRKESKTFGKKAMAVVGESNPASVLVPLGVVHGYKAVSHPGSQCINLPDTLYAGWDKKEAVDEIRHENNLHSPFRIP